jgi:hypothetical protein
MMTPLERKAGRFMRSEDHGSGDDAGDGAGNGDGNGADKGAEGADGAGAEGDATTVLGGADAGTGADGKAGEEAGKDDDAGEGGDDKGKETDAAAQVPEAYELTATIKDAEGKDVPVEIDAALLEKATPLFKEAGLTNDQANKLAPLALDIAAQALKKQNDDFDGLKADWAKAAQKDAEIGGKNWAKSQEQAAKALDHFGAPKGSEFRKLLDDSGLGNHPEMIRMFSKMGATIKEDDNLEGGDRNPKGKKDKLETLYPDDVPQKQS